MGITLLIVGCYTSNGRGEQNTTPDSTPPEVQTSEYVAAAPTHVETFIEVSGSMSGYYGGTNPTQFKSDVWKILSSMRNHYDAESITLLSDKRPTVLSIDLFKDRMNNGRLPNSNWTDLPSMLSMLINHVDTLPEAVAILISDMKYSPAGKAQKVLMAQYATDIQNKLHGKQVAISLVAANSEFRTNSKRCEASPYYYLLVGSPKCVAEVRNRVVEALRQSGTYVETVEKGADYGSRLIAIPIDTRGVFPTDKENLHFGGYDRKVSDTATIALGIDISSLPPFMQNIDSLQRYTTVSASEMGRCTARVQAVQDGIAIMEIKAFDLKAPKHEVQLGLVSFNPSLPRNMKQFYGAERENECDKTLSIDSFIAGIYDSRNLNPSIQIVITQK